MIVSLDLIVKTIKTSLSLVKAVSSWQCVDTPVYTQALKPTDETARDQWEAESRLIKAGLSPASASLHLAFFYCQTPEKQQAL